MKAIEHSFQFSCYLAKNSDHILCLNKPDSEFLYEDLFKYTCIAAIVPAPIKSHKIFMRKYRPLSLHVVHAVSGWCVRCAPKWSSIIYYYLTASKQRVTFATWTGVFRPSFARRLAEMGIACSYCVSPGALQHPLLSHSLNTPTSTRRM